MFDFGECDVALVQCPGWGRDCPPYALAALSAYARQKGVRVKGFDFNNALYHASPEGCRKLWDDKDYYVFWENPARVNELMRDNAAVVDRQIEALLETRARVIGFSTHTTSALASLEMARRIKEKDPQKIIVFGGPQCSLAQAGRRFINERCVDAVCLLEGEEVLCEIVSRVREDDGFRRPIAGALVKNGSEIIDGGERELIADLNDVPMPDYSDFEKDILDRKYRQPERLEVFDSRGCVRRCHFCSEWQFWRRFRSMSGDRIYGEMTAQMKKYPGVDYFYFIGSLLNGDMKSLERLCDLIIDNGLKVRFAGQAIIRPDMDEKFILKLRKAGCEWLGIGIESGSEKVLKYMNKPFSLADAERVLRDCHNAGIGLQINIMFGLPSETTEDFQLTLDFLRRVRPYIDSVLASQSFTVVDKGTALNVSPETFGLTGVDHHLYWESIDGTNTYPERLRRYEEFCRVALDLGIPETSGVLRVKPDKWFLLGDYYRHSARPVKAVRCYLNSWRKESKNATLLVRIAECCREIQRSDRAAVYYAKALKENDSMPEHCLEDIRRAYNEVLKDVERRNTARPATPARAGV